MTIRNGFSALGVAAMFGLSACSGGGGAGSASVPQGQPAAPGAPAQAVSRTYLLAGSAGSYDAPQLAGFRASLAFPAAAVPPNTSLEITSSFQAPADAPVPADAHRRPQSTGTLNVYFYATIRLSNTVTFPTLPGFSVLPATVNPAGLQFFYAISDPKPVNGAVLQFRTEGPALVVKQNVSFAPSTTPLTLQAGRRSTIAFYATSEIAANASPTPAAAAKIYVTNIGNTDFMHNPFYTLTTYDATSGAQTTPTITGLSDEPLGVAVDARGKIYIVCTDGTTGTNILTSYDANGTPAAPTITGLNQPFGVAVDAGGNIHIANGNNTVTTYAASGMQIAPTISAGLDEPVAIAVGAKGKLFVANYAAGTVTTYNADGTRTTPTIAGLNAPNGVAVDSAGKIYVANYGDGDPGRGSITTYTASGTPAAPTISGLTGSSAVAVDATGNIYVVDQNDSVLTTYRADGTPASPTVTAGLFQPAALAVR
jgi:hypothetical protein